MTDQIGAPPTFKVMIIPNAEHWPERWIWMAVDHVQATEVWNLLGRADINPDDTRPIAQQRHGLFDYALTDEQGAEDDLHTNDEGGPRGPSDGPDGPEPRTVGEQA